MSDRENQTIPISRQTLLVVTGLSVGLLTLSYVLGVQVGRQSAALRKPLNRGTGGELEELPAPVAEQLKLLEKEETAKPVEAPPKPVESPAPGVAVPKAETVPAKPSPTVSENGLWTLQLVSTSDAAEAKRVVAKAKEAGCQASVVQDGKVFKVRLAKPVPRGEIDPLVERLKGKGFKPFLFKTE